VGRLIVGTEGAEWIIEGDGNGVLTPIVDQPARIGSYERRWARSARSRRTALALRAGAGLRVRELQSNVQFGYVHVRRRRRHALLERTWSTATRSSTGRGSRSRRMCVWAVRSDGVLLGLTYIPEQEVLAWHRHDTKGFIENVCVVPEGKTHWVYWVAKR
jgi:hypothetical protein